MKENYEILIDDKVWIFYPKSRGGLDSAIAQLDDALAEGDDPAKYRIVYSQYDAEGLTQRYDVFDVEWDEYELNGYAQSMNESMDGDFDSAMTSAGFGTDEDYGYFGGDE